MNTDFMTTQDSDAYRFMNLDSQNYPWGFTSVGGDTAVANGYAGEGIKIAVLDTGISSHPDLAIAGGASFVEGTADYTDDYGRGTHVSGTIGALNNGIGTIGVAPQASLYAVKVLNSYGNGYAINVIQGIQWAVDNEQMFLSFVH